MLIMRHMSAFFLFLFRCDEPYISEPPESYPFASACIKKLKDLEIRNRRDILVLVKSGEISARIWCRSIFPIWQRCSSLPSFPGIGRIADRSHLVTTLKGVHRCRLEGKVVSGAFHNTPKSGTRVDPRAPFSPKTFPD